MKKVLFALFIILSVASCSKESRIKNNLWKQGGDWSILAYSTHYGSYNPSHPSYPGYIDFYEDCGDFKFSKDGSGTLTLRVDGEVYVDAFTYSNTEEKLILIFDGNYAREYKLDWNKNSMTITYNNDGKDPDGYDTFDNESYVLSKKK